MGKGMPSFPEMEDNVSSCLTMADELSTPLRHVNKAAQPPPPDISGRSRPTKETRSELHLIYLNGNLYPG
jgi:hypothetical protein